MLRNLAVAIPLRNSDDRHTLFRGTHDHALPDFEAWAIFARVAAARSFTAAAHDLGLTKSTVSKAVRRLEAHLGVDLFHRTTRRLALTDAGVRARENAERLLAAAEIAEADAASEGGILRGRIRLAAPMSFGLRHVAPRLPAFLAAHPQVSVDIELGDALVDLVAQGFDLAFRIAALADSTLRARRLCPIGRSLVAAPAYLDRHRMHSHPRDLASHACLGYSYLPSGDSWHLVGPDKEEVIVRPVGPLRANNADALSSAVYAGCGIAVQPDFVIWDDLRSGRLLKVLPGWSLPPIALHVLTPPGRHRAPSVSALIAHLERDLTTAPWAGLALGRTVE